MEEGPSLIRKCITGALKKDCPFRNITVCCCQQLRLPIVSYSAISGRFRLNSQNPGKNFLRDSVAHSKDYWGYCAAITRPHSDLGNITKRLPREIPWPKRYFMSWTTGDSGDCVPHQKVASLVEAMHFKLSGILSSWKREHIKGNIFLQLSNFEKMVRIMHRVRQRRQDCCLHTVEIQTENSGLRWQI